MYNFRQVFLSSVIRNKRKLLKCNQVLGKPRNHSTVEIPPVVNAVPSLTIPKGIFGQPTCHTHPHMIPQDQLTCGITQAEYKERRETLVQKLSAEVENIYKSHIIVIPAARKQYMSDKIPYVFRQNSDFFYLTGCMEPSSVLVLVKPAQTDHFKSDCRLIPTHQGDPQWVGVIIQSDQIPIPKGIGRFPHDVFLHRKHSVLFVNDKDSHAELWEGPRTGCAAATSLFAVDEARPVENFPGFLNKISSTSKPSILWYHNEEPANPDLHRTVRSALNNGATLHDPQRALHFMRVVKSPAEIELLKETCYIGSQSINMAMACTRPGVSEELINAVLEYTCKQAGAEHLAFPPVVAGGPRATHIHYVANNQLLADNEMILVDSGSQRWLYNSDISRTWPVSGKFSKHHRILYELVLTVQKRIIELLGEYRPPLDQLFDHMCRLLGTHLQEEGILPKTLDANELITRAYRLCPHHVSHYLGMDVHDTPLVKRNTPVRTNMLVTVEPGIYIRPDDTSIPEEFRGVGIRVEDDVLVTDAEPLVLTNTCVKEVEDIEAIVGKHSL